MPETTVGILMSITPKNRVLLRTYPLEDIDTLRDNILTTKGNITFNVTGDDSIPLLKSFAERLPNGKLNTTSVQYGIVNFETNTISLPKFKKPIKCKLHRRFEGNSKTVTISKTPTGKYFVSVLVSK